MDIQEVKEYVAYHRQKLREQQARSTSSTSVSTSTPRPQSAKKRGGVNQIHSLASFKTSVLEGSADKIVVVGFFNPHEDFYEAMEPFFESLKEEYAGIVEFVKVNLDEAPDIVKDQQIENIPSFSLFKSGKMVDEPFNLHPTLLINRIQALL